MEILDYLWVCAQLVHVAWEQVGAEACLELFAFQRAHVLCLAVLTSSTGQFHDFAVIPIHPMNN